MPPTGPKTLPAGRTYTEIELPIHESLVVSGDDGVIATIQYVALTHERTCFPPVPQARLGITADRSVPVFRSELVVTPKQSAE